MKMRFVGLPIQIYLMHYSISATMIRFQRTTKKRLKTIIRR